MGRENKNTKHKNKNKAIKIATLGAVVASVVTPGIGGLESIKVEASAVSNIIVPAQVEESNSDLAVKQLISWTATKASGLKGYRVEVTYDDGSSWNVLKTPEQQGTSTVYQYDVPADKTGNTAKFRITAVDNTNMESQPVISTGLQITPAMYHWSIFSVTENNLEYINLDDAAQHYVGDNGVQARQESGWILEEKVRDDGSIYLVKQKEYTATYKNRYIEHKDGRYKYMYEPGTLLMIVRAGTGEWREQHYNLQFTTENQILKNQLEEAIIGNENAYTNNAKNSDGFWYERGQRIQMFDNTGPIIELSEQETYGTTSKIKVRTHDLSAVVVTKWAKGTYTKDNFPTSATTLETSPSTEISFTVSENGPYTVYAEDDKGNTATQSITVTKVNNAPVISKIETAKTFQVVDEKTDFVINIEASDADPQMLRSKVTYANNVTTESEDLSATLKGSSYSKGLNSSTITATVNDGIIDSQPYKLENYLVIKVDNATEYQSLLVVHSDIANTYTEAQHQAFYNAYEAMQSYQADSTEATYTTATETVNKLKEVTKASTVTEEWEADLNNTRALLALANAEFTLEKADYQEASTLIEGLTNKSQEVTQRLESLQAYHTANDKVVVLESEMARHTADAAISLDEIIINTTQLQEALELIAGTADTQEQTYNTLLSDRLQNVQDYYFNNKAQLTEEDLASLGETLDESLPEGFYSDLKDAFKPVVTNVSSVVDYTDSVVNVLRNVDQVSLDSYLELVNNLPKDTGIDFTKLDSVTQALKAMVQYRKAFKEDAPSVDRMNAVIAGVTLGDKQLKPYMALVVNTLKEVTEYNTVGLGETHSEEEKVEAQASIEKLWGSEFKTKMQEYLDNGIPTVDLTTPSYGVYAKDTVTIKGKVVDKELAQQAYNVTVEFAGLSATTSEVNPETGEFTVTFTDTSSLEEVTLQDFTLTVSDGKTETSHKKQLIVIKGTNEELTSELVSKLVADDVPVNSLETITKVVDLVNELDQVQDNPAAPSVAHKEAFIAKAQELNGDKTSLTTLVEELLQKSYLDWLAQIDASNLTIEHLKVSEILDEQQFEFVENNFDLVVNTLIDLQKSDAGKSLTPKAIIDVISLLSGKGGIDTLIAQVAETKTSTELQPLVDEFNNFVDAIPEWAGAYKDFYSNELAKAEYKLQELYAKEALEKVKESLSQSDYDKAKDLINALKDGEFKDNLKAQLEDLLDGVQANELANKVTGEEDPSQEDLDKLQDLINGLGEGDLKEQLQEKLNIVLAELAVKKAIENKTQENLDSAEEAIELVVSPEVKSSLTDELSIVPEYLQVTSEADKVVNNFEKSKEHLEQLLSAKAKLQDLNNKINITSADSVVIVGLVDKVESSIGLLEEEFLVDIAVAAVGRVKDTWLKVDFDDAQEAVNKLKEGNIKDDLQNQLNELLPFVEAYQSSVNGNLFDRDLDELKDLINTMPDGANKDKLIELVNIKEAELAVKIAIDNKIQENLQTAEDKISKVTDESERSSLTDKLSIVVEYLEAVASANALLMLEEVTIDNITDLAEAKSTVDNLMSHPDINENDKDVLIDLSSKLSEAGSNMQDELDALKALEDYKNSASEEDYNKLIDAINKLDDGAIKDQIQQELDKLIAGKDLVNNKLEELQNSDNLTQEDIDNLKDLINKLPDGSYKDELLNKVQDLQNKLDANIGTQNKAEAAVEKAENSLSQKDKDDAQKLVEALPESGLKNSLLDRLEKVQDSINDQSLQDRITSELESLVNSLDPEHIDSIQNLINQLEDGEDKSKLQEQLDKLKQQIDSLYKIESAVVHAESDPTKDNLNVAQDLLDTYVYTYGTDSKAEDLQDRLDIIKDFIAIEDFLDSLKGTPSQDDLDRLSDLINRLPDGELKDELLDILQELQDVLNSKLSLEDLATKAVVTVENTLKQSDYKVALDKVSILPDSEIKSSLTDRLDKVLESIAYSEALTAVELAEDSKSQSHITLAQELISKVIDSAKREELQERLDVIKRSVEAVPQQKEVWEDLVNGVDISDKLQDLADSLDEVIYKDLVDDYSNILQELINVNGSVSKQEVIDVVRLVNALEIAKRSMVEADIKVYGDLLVKANSIVHKYFPKPEIMLATMTYITSSNQYRPDLVRLVAEMLNLSENDVKSQIDELINAMKGLTQGTYAVKYLDVNNPSVELLSYEVASFGELVVTPIAPEGYSLVDTEEVVFNFQQEDIGKTFTFKVKKNEVPNSKATTGDSIDIEVELEGSTEKNEENPVIQDTVVSTFTMGRSLMANGPIASLEGIKFSSNTIITTTTKDLEDLTADHKEYLALTAKAAVLVGEFLQESTDENRKFAYDFIIDNLLSGPYKFTLLELLGVQEDQLLPELGEIDLEAVYPSANNLEPKPEVEPTPGTSGSLGDLPSDSPSSSSSSNFINKPDIDVITVSTDVNGNVVWKISKPTKDNYSLIKDANGIELTLGKSIKGSLDLIEVSWVEVSKDHYTVVVKVDGKKVSDYEAKVKFYSEYKYMMLQTETGYKATPYKLKDGSFTLNYKQDAVYFFHSETKEFKDVGRHVPQKRYIDELASRGILNGTGDDKFSPTRKVTRAHFAVILTRALGLEPSSKDTPFIDTKGEWHESEIKALYEAGLVHGTTRTTYNPQDNITRQQAAMMLYRFLSKTETHNELMKNNADYANASKADFKDANKIAQEAQEAVAKLQAVGVFEGTKGGKFNPYASLTREQLVEAIYKTLSLTEDI